MAPTRSTINASAKRRNKRKARTEVSSESESESDFEASSSAVGEGEGSLAEVPAGHPSSSSSTAKAHTNDPHTEIEQVSAAKDDDNTVAPPASRRQPANPEQAFRDFYLRQATREFANDLDKLRSAGDFGGKSIGLLVGALEQGGACFGVGERGRVAVAGGVGRV
ncbi:hypothetical protein LTR86_009521 [Recurvomyces mirabilis]|nr:hypothetical protein LTR86_009521 [Recurvomyces mirabilis]